MKDGKDIQGKAGEMDKPSFKAGCVEFRAAFGPSGLLREVDRDGGDLHGWGMEAPPRFCKPAAAQNPADEGIGVYGQVALFIFGQSVEESALEIPSAGPVPLASPNSRETP